jgi:NAD(P)-dependent dehydrogenase (short-subunit alcohol dehydrogenase family)
VAVSGPVLTTGANSGIGLATVIEVARQGFESIGSVRSAAKARVVRDAAREAGVEVRTVILDVTDEAQCRRIVDRLKPFGIVNNAGFGAVGAIEDVSDAEAHAVFETMVFAPLRLARLALPHMRERSGGRIVNVSSIYGLTTTPLSGWYQGAKHALEGLSDALRVEVAKDNVKVILVEPGGFDTGIWDDTHSEVEKRPDSKYRTAYGRLQASVKLSRPLMGHPGQVAKVIARALAARRPSPRYLVGADAQVIAFWDRLVPTEVKDRVTRISLGL